MSQVALHDQRHHAVVALVDMLCRLIPPVGSFTLDAPLLERLWLDSEMGLTTNGPDSFKRL